MQSRRRRACKASNRRSGVTGSSRGRRPTASQIAAASAGAKPCSAPSLASLAPKFRLVLGLVDLEEMTYREAAVVLEVPVGTVMSRLFRARRQFALALGAPALSASPLGAAAPAEAA